MALHRGDSSLTMSRSTFHLTSPKLHVSAEAQNFNGFLDMPLDEGIPGDMSILLSPGICGQ